MVSDQVKLPLPAPLHRLEDAALEHAGAADGLAFYTDGARGGFQGQEEAFHTKASKL